MTENVHQSWHSVLITVEPKAAGAVEFAFNELGSLGTEINHLRKTVSDAVVVRGYFIDTPDDETLQDELHYALRVYGFTDDAVVSIERHEVENTDWLAEWKKHWKPSEVGEFIIAPPWEEVDDPERIVIKIERNMAFGTGTHETTQLCLKAIEKNYEAGQSFCDVGTGTGILAIAAAKLLRFESSEAAVENTKTWIFACDTDADSIAIAAGNALLNGVREQIEFCIGSISKDTPQFDFVCANFTIDVILPILPLLMEKTKKTLVLSGILREQEKMIRAEFKELGIANYSIDHDGEWISVITESHPNKRTIGLHRCF